MVIGDHIPIPIIARENFIDNIINNNKNTNSNMTTVKKGSTCHI